MFKSAQFIPFPARAEQIYGLPGFNLIAGANNFVDKNKATHLKVLPTTTFSSRSVAKIIAKRVVDFSNHQQSWLIAFIRDPTNGVYQVFEKCNNAIQGQLVG